MPRNYSITKKPKKSANKKLLSVSSLSKKSQNSTKKLKKGITKTINTNNDKTNLDKNKYSLRKASSLSNIKSRSREESSEVEKKITKKNVKLFKNKLNNINTKKIKLNKNLIQKKKEKKEKNKDGEEYSEDEKQSEEEKNDDESIHSFSEKRLEYLPCRKEEQDIIYNYIKKGLQTKGNYNSLYIAGMPGTGKTSSVKTIINILESELKEAQKNKKNLKNLINDGIIPFKTLFINGFEYPNISNVFKKIYNFIFAKEKPYTITKYIQVLDNFFSDRKKYNSSIYLNDPTNSHIVLIIDEIDILINNNQNLLYNIFNWTTYEDSKLIVISISNTLDLPNRLFPKIKSRMGDNKIMFKPYNKEEIRKIIESRGIDLKLFSEDALRFSCIKVATINGDLRRVFQILKRAKDINKSNNFKSKDKNKSLVSKFDILDAWNELFNSKTSKVIQSLQIIEKIIIASMLCKIKDNTATKIKIEDLYDKEDIFLKKYNEHNDCRLTITWEEFKRSIFNLMRIKLLSFSEMPKNNLIDNFVVIKFYTDEFIMALEDDHNFKPVLDYLTQLINK